MTLALKLHTAIVQYNVLKTPTDRTSDFFLYHPNLFKVALLVNHLFRAAAMTGFMLFLPFSAAVNMGICLAGSLFYRLTVEDKCAYKFALPAFAGAAAFLMGKAALTRLITGVAFASLGAFATAFIAIIPLGIYLAYVLLTISHDVDNRICPLCTN
ncbi:MAG TPA: hypothetical protein VLE89_02440 [Chlamydiales bacterium]|nr:hypothetical protein [Chlamydiales bacterium]